MSSKKALMQTVTFNFKSIIFLQIHSRFRLQCERPSVTRAAATSDEIMFLKQHCRDRFIRFPCDINGLHEFVLAICNPSRNAKRFSFVGVLSDLHQHALG